MARSPDGRRSPRPPAPATRPSPRREAGQLRRGAPGLEPADRHRHGHRGVARAPVGPRPAQLGVEIDVRTHLHAEVDILVEVLVLWARGPAERLRLLAPDRAGEDAQGQRREEGPQRGGHGVALGGWRGSTGGRTGATHSRAPTGYPAGQGGDMHRLSLVWMAAAALSLGCGDKAEGPAGGPDTGAGSDGADGDDGDDGSTEETVYPRGVGSCSTTATTATARELRKGRVHCYRRPLVGHLRVEHRPPGQLHQRTVRPPAVGFSRPINGAEDFCRRRSTR